MRDHSQAVCMHMYEKMLLIRYSEQKLEALFAEGQVHGTTHLYIGQEAVAAGVCEALEPKDLILSTHRGHGHCIAKGIDIAAMMAEFLGRETGCCGGRGGSMHIADFEHGNLGTNGIVGGGLPLAVGAALAQKMRGENQITVCFFGDGASNEGIFHESLNLASIWKLPVLYVCEDNKYGLSMATSASMSIKDISIRATSFGMPGKTVDGNDVFAVYDQAKNARAYVLNNGPMLLVCDTYRISGHSKSDKNVYRPKDEIERWKKKDPIVQMKKVMLSHKILTRGQINDIEKRAKETVDDAAAFAQHSPFPSKETVRNGVYA